MCDIVLIWTMILLTLGNNVVTLLFNWPKPVHHVPTNKINASIRIRRILKVKIPIRWMRILTSFVTSLNTTICSAVVWFQMWRLSMVRNRFRFWQKDQKLYCISACIVCVSDNVHWWWWHDDDAADDDDQLIMSVTVSDGVAASVRGLRWIHTEDDARWLPRVRLCSNILQADDFTGHSHANSLFVISEQRKPFNKFSCFRNIWVLIPRYMPFRIFK